MPNYSAVSIPAFVAMALLAAPLEASRVVDALPPDVFVWVDIPDLPQARAAGAETAYGEIMAEPAVRRFIDDGFPALSDLGNDFRAATGVGWRKMLDFCKGEATFALVPDGADGIAAVAVLYVGKGKMEFEDFLSTGESLTGLAWDETQIPGAAVRSARFEGFTIAYALAEEYFILSTSPEQLKSVTGGLLSGRKGALAEDPLFAKCRSLVTVGKPDLTVYARLSFLTPRLMAWLPQYAQIIKESGIDSIEAVVYANKAVQEGFVDETILYFPSGRRGIFAALESNPAGAGQHYSMIPAGCESASWTSADLKALIDTLAALYPAVPASVKSRLDGIIPKLDESGEVDFRKELRESLGKNIVSYKPLSTSPIAFGLSGGFGQQVTLVELADPARFEKAIEKLWEQTAAKQQDATEKGATKGSGADKPQVVPGIERFGDRAIYHMRISLSPVIQIVPAMAVRDNWLVVSGDALSVKNALSGPREFGSDIRQNEDYQNAARLTGTGNLGFSYTNTRAVFDQTYPLVAFGLPFALAQMRGEAPIDQLLLPSVDAVSPHLFGSAQSMNMDLESIRLVSYGPIGTVRSAYLAGTAAAALGKWFIKSQAPKAPREPAWDTSAEDQLRSLGSFLTEYASAHGGAYPGGVEESEFADFTRHLEAKAPAYFRYVPGLSSDDDGRLILAFELSSGPSGRRVLLVGPSIMHMTDSEVIQQVGGWLTLNEDTAAQACLENVRVLAESVRRYAETHEGRLPEALDVRSSYRFAPLVTNCPADAEVAEADYTTVSGADVSRVAESNQREFLLVYETGTRHNGLAAAGFLDGTVRRLNAVELQEAIIRTKQAAGLPARVITPRGK